VKLAEIDMSAGRSEKEGNHKKTFVFLKKTIGKNGSNSTICLQGDIHVGNDFFEFYAGKSHCITSAIPVITVI
jgi:hypothetical protein